MRELARLGRRCGQLPVLQLVDGLDGRLRSLGHPLTTGLSAGIDRATQTVGKTTP